MKYVRIKDGRVNETEYLTRRSEDCFSLGGFLLTAIKESDNIEDLLDETVAFYKEGTKFHWGAFPIEEVIGFYRANKNKETQLDFLGGYVWNINDNLIKVAELTDEGWKLI